MILDKTGDILCDLQLDKTVVTDPEFVLFQALLWLFPYCISFMFSVSALTSSFNRLTALVSTERTVKDFDTQVIQFVIVGCPV